MDVARSRSIGAGSSMVLDSLRILAAFTVVVFHASRDWLIGYQLALETFSRVAHAAVMLFFVLSGYVIAFSTSSSNRGPRQYAVARLSRLYAVVIPVLLLTALVEVFVGQADAALAAHYTRGASWPRYVLSALFSNEIGLLSAAPPLNTPLWSLSFEFWYYLIFGLWFYRRFTRQWGWLLLGAGLVAGPKILLLMPVWLFGAGAYHWPQPRLSTRLAGLCSLVMVALASLAVLYLPPLPYELGFKPLFLASQFLTDWVVGILVALAVWALPAGSTVNTRWVQRLRKYADLSFPLYALHYPLLVLWRVLVSWRANDVMQWGQAIAFATISSVVIGLFLDSQRKRWVRFFEWVFDAWNSRRH
jgi:peptidoglycan/LPS O-acetylase OafA/YrhL